MASHQVLTAGYQGPLASATLPGTDAVRILLVGLRSPVRAGLRYPVVFHFEQAGELRLDLPVETPHAAVSARPTAPVTQYSVRPDLAGTVLGGWAGGLPDPAPGRDLLPANPRVCRAGGQDAARSGRYCQRIVGCGPQRAVPAEVILGPEGGHSARQPGAEFGRALVGPDV
jgi:hypothetical protein